MPSDDNQDTDGDDFRPPRHPDDRLWRHPAELAWEASMAAHGASSPGSSPSENATTDPTASPRSPNRSFLGTVVISSLFGASFALLTVFATGLATRDEPSPAASASNLTPSETPVLLSTNPLGVAEIADRIQPSVAQIRVLKGDQTTEASAVVWNTDGYLVTDAQTVDNADTVAVTLADGTTETASVVGVDQVTKLAVLHIDSPITVTQPFGHDPILVGDWGMAFGVSESGLPAISSGTISGVEERLRTEDGTLLYGMVRLGAPLPYGVAGGPLISANGEILGIFLKGPSDSPFSWAVPTTYANKVVTELIETGNMTHAWLGVEGERRSGGTTITRVTPNSPASVAGLRQGDVLLRVNNEPLLSMITLVTKIRLANPGDTISFTFERDGEVRTTDAVLAGR